MSPPAAGLNPPEASPRPANRFWRGAGWALAVLAVGWFYAWAPATFPGHWLGARPAGFYAELGDAFLGGQLSLARQPDPRLVALPDPYDPAQNQPWRVNDLSYYRGRYYLYHSAVPVLVLYAPIRLLTGCYLTDRSAIFLFCLGGFAAGLSALLLLWRRCLPHCPAAVVLGCAGMLALGDGYHAVLRDATVYQVAIASAHFFLMVALFGMLRALLAARRAWAWLALASLAYGLAVGSRPNYVFGGLALLVPVWAGWRHDGFRWSRPVTGWLLAAGLPAAFVVGGLLLYNHLRFENPFEFGMRYQLGEWDQRTIGGLSLKYGLENAWHYLLSPPDFHGDFPFVTSPTWLATGVLVHTPFVWLALLAGLTWRLKDGPGDGAGRTWGAALLILLAANLGVLVLFPSGNREAVLASANARYVLDFQPALVLLAGLGAMTAGHLAAAHPRRRRSLVAVVAGLALVSMLAGLSLDFQRLPPETYRPLARWLDRPYRVWQGLRHAAYGPIGLELEFPADRIGGYEPLVATGTAAAGDLVYVHYEDPDHIRFGLVGVGLPGPVSDSIPVTLGAPHRVDIFMGSLVPPGDHPALARFSEAQVNYLERHLRIDLDGRTVFTAMAHFYPASPRAVQIGRTSILRDYCAAHFTGQITAVRRLAVTPPDLAPQGAPLYGAVRLVVRFPLHPDSGAEPLLVTGVRLAGDLVSVQYADQQRLRLVLDHWGHASLQSDWRQVDLAADHVLEIWMGSLFPRDPAAGRSGFTPDEVNRWKHHVRVTLDGQVVLEADQDIYESSPYDVVIGKNVIGASNCGYAFTGEIRECRRLPPAAAGL